MLEYSALLVLVLAGFIAMHIYISRGFAGKWKDAGDSFGSGRQFDPNFTEECAYSETLLSWYEVTCFEQRKNQGRIDQLFNDCYEGCGIQRCIPGRHGLCADHLGGIVPGHQEFLPICYEVPDDKSLCAPCCLSESKKAYEKERVAACLGDNCNRPRHPSFGPEEF